MDGCVSMRRTTMNRRLWNVEPLAGWLARDDHRYAIASVLPFLPAFLVFRFVESDGSTRTAVMLYVTTYGILWCLCQVVLTWLVFGRIPADAFSALIEDSQPERGRVHRLFRGLDEGAVSLGTQVSVLMLLLTGFVFATPSLRENVPVVLLSAGMVVSSWMLTAFSYAIAYARADHRQRGLEFPGEEAPGFSDYLYFAICVNATFATSDVTLVARAMRRLATTQTVIAFGFNTVIFALLITLLTETSR